MKIKVGKYSEAPIKKSSQDGKPHWELMVPEIPKEKVPKVSVVTITKDRSHLVRIMLYNWSQIKYPEDKLEWIIVDDSKEDTLRMYLPLMDDERIRYYHTEPFKGLAEKRNYACSLCSGEYIAMMDDDDYYFPDHIMAKVRLLYHSDKVGVHSMPIAVYNILDDTSYIYEWCKPNKQTNSISEGSLLLKRDYWKTHPFQSNKPNQVSEGMSIIGRNHHKFFNLHFLFNGITITHSKNITGTTRKVDQAITEKTIHDHSFREIFPDTFNYILEQLSTLLKN